MRRDDLDDDWESTALRLVAARVDALAAPPAGSASSPRSPDPDIDADTGYGWEDTVIRRLRAWMSRGAGDD